MLVSLVQGVVSAFDKNFRPLNEGGGQETGKRANNDFLKEGGVHHHFHSSEGARSPTH